MHKRITAFLEKHNLLYGLQFGFRAKHSTTHALINVTEKSDLHWIMGKSHVDFL